MKNRKQVLNYLIFGVLTTGVNIVSFWFLVDQMSIDYKLATTIAWALSVLFAFVTNKVYVFRSKNGDVETLTKEFLAFLFFRSLSYLLDLGIMIVAIDVLLVNSMFAKVIANGFVIIANYFASKYIIFKPAGARHP